MPDSITVNAFSPKLDTGSQEYSVKRINCKYEFTSKKTGKVFIVEKDDMPSIETYPQQALMQFPELHASGGGRRRTKHRATKKARKNRRHSRRTAK